MSVCKLKALDDIFDKYFKLEFMGGKNKIMPLEYAVQEYIKPRMHLYSAYLPFAITYEIVRQFHGRNTDFTVSCLGGIENANVLIASGLVKRLIASYAGLILPSPAMSAVLQQALSQRLEIENWSLLTMIQRLMTAALNLPFMPTRSLEGSSMAEENEERMLYKRIADPFTGEEVSIIKPLKPDIAIMHAYCADPAGNAIPILSPVEEAYGAFASKEGVILSVEKIVSTEYLRKHSLHVKVPANIVKCVVEAPFGMHPYGCRGHDSGGYGEDADFARKLQTAFKENEAANSWIKEWVLDVNSHVGFLHKLGSERLYMLRDRVSYASWKTDASKIVDNVSDAPANRTERAVVFAAREIIDTIQKNRYETALAGIGISHLAAWVATYRLRAKGINVHLLVELGLFGYLPPPGQPFLVSARGMESCLMLTDTLSILGLIANNTPMLACMSAGQVDKYGNINSTKVGDLFLFGSGGANDISMTAKEVIVALLHDKRRLVQEVPYITCPGHNVKKVVTDRAVFEKVENELVLKKIYVEKGQSKDQAMSVTVQNMGWTPKIDRKLVRRLEEPLLEEIILLRCFDPDRYFLGKL